MPTVPRPDYRPYYFEVDNSLWEGLIERCQKTRRAVKAEMNMALAFWLQQPLNAMPEITEPAVKTEPPKPRKGKR